MSMTKSRNRLVIIATCGAIVSSGITLPGLSRGLPWYMMMIGVAGTISLMSMPYLSVVRISEATRIGRENIGGLTFGLALYALLDLVVKWVAFFRPAHATDVIFGALMPFVSLPLIAIVTGLWMAGERVGRLLSRGENA